MATKPGTASLEDNQYGFSEEPQIPDDSALVYRLFVAYELSKAEFGGHGSSFWAQFESKHADFFAAIQQRDLIRLTHLASKPVRNNAFFRFR
jgi:hypothetical protein